METQEYKGKTWKLTGGGPNGTWWIPIDLVNDPHEPQVAPNAWIDPACEVFLDKDVYIGGHTRIYRHHHNEAIQPWDNANHPEIVTYPLYIGEGTYLGFRIFVTHKAKKIGKNVSVGAHSVITKDIPDNVVVAGNPARIIKKK